ncbi:hypothetical protein L3Y34_018738 [Caenorhabditis briggsae]|uniref:Uncharacterized protein n=1 Tax=Caenorhabditis briggsae TaxID=6238 RepID=A0AAE9IVT0_CAEBR|nr:hypothetical protein L3Y34_018738 [Caenorhabditis briggsae]
MKILSSLLCLSDLLRNKGNHGVVEQQITELEKKEDEHCSRELRIIDFGINLGMIDADPCILNSSFDIAYLNTFFAKWNLQKNIYRAREAMNNVPVLKNNQNVNHATFDRLDEHHQERSESPRIFDERLAMELRNRLYFIPRAQKAFHDPEEPSKETSQNEINGGCLRVYDEEKNSEENVRGIVEIRQCDNPSIRHTMKVIVVDCHHDFVILYSTVGRDIFDDYPFSSRSPRNFEWFLGFGLSYKNQGGRQVTHRSGRICSVMDYRGQMLASASIDGDSGGPCYSEDRSLIGIMVSSTTTDPLLAHEYDRETMEEELRDASSSPADTWITPGNLIIEAFSVSYYF